MSTTTQKLNALFGKIPKSKWIDASQEWEQNLAWIKKSQSIALEILEALDLEKMSQKDLAGKMGVSPQLVNKWLRGKENFTLETISKLEVALKINLVEVLNNAKQKESIAKSINTNFEGNYEVAPIRNTNTKAQSKGAKVIQMGTRSYAEFSEVM